MRQSRMRRRRGCSQASLLRLFAKPRQSCTKRRARASLPHGLGCGASGSACAACTGTVRRVSIAARTAEVELPDAALETVAERDLETVLPKEGGEARPGHGGAPPALQAAGCRPTARLPLQVLVVGGKYRGARGVVLGFETDLFKVRVQLLAGAADDVAASTRKEVLLDYELACRTA